MATRQERPADWPVRFTTTIATKITTIVDLVERTHIPTMAMHSHPPAADLRNPQAPSRTMILAYETGGAWREDEAAQVLEVSVDDVRSWCHQGRVLSLPDDAGLPMYPAIQFMPKKKGESAILPGIDRVIATAGARLDPREIFAILATHQDWLATDRERTRTPFAALAAGEADAVVALIAHVVTPDDLDAPLLRCTVCGSEHAWPAGMTDPDLGEIFLCGRHRNRALDYT